MTHDRAREIVWKYIMEHGAHLQMELVIEDNRTIKKPYGWIFFFCSKRFLEGDPRGEIYGKGPLAVLPRGEVIHLGSAWPVEARIAEFEAKMKKRSLAFRLCMWFASTSSAGGKSP